MKHTSHESAYHHVLGRSIFVGDERILEDEVQVGLFLSTYASARINEIDFSEALQVEGIEGIYTAKDFAENYWGTRDSDQPLLADDLVSYYGEPICVIAYHSRDAYQEACSKIRVDYLPLEPILDLKSAIKQNKFIGQLCKLQCGQPQQAYKMSLYHLEGEFSTGGQEHLYLETQSARAIPGEGEQLHVESSSQNPTEVQHVVANSIGIGYHQVICSVRRMGGAFGGKESQASPFAAYVALVAKKLRRPARIVLNYDEDMLITGKRHPFLFKYKVGFEDNGKIKSLLLDCYSDGGAYEDLSVPILERALLHCDGAYKLENALLTGRVARTNFAPNTAFRGFGAPQGMAAIEFIMEMISTHLQIDSLKIRRVNCYDGPNPTTHYGQVIENNTLPKVFDALTESSQYWLRKKSLNSSKNTLKGLSLTAVKFGISFTAKFLNQGNARVNVHLDGTVQVSTGATEMGQGVTTKIQTVVAQAFGIDPFAVQILATSTDRNHNTSPTAASAGSDINGSAALIACEKIKERLVKFAFGKDASASDVAFQDGELFVKSDPSKRVGFKGLIKKAYFERISLGDYGFYTTPLIDFDFAKGKGRPFLYYTNGVAVSEVDVDPYTGEYKVSRVDLLMDLGSMIHPGVDYGQTTGAFIQGMGYATCESLHYDDAGQMLGRGPAFYKVPSVHDVPRVFKINFLENPENHVNLLSSKAVGEPPFVLGVSVFTAIIDALRRAGVDKNQLSKISLPLTPEGVLKALENF